MFGNLQLIYSTFYRREPVDKYVELKKGQSNVFMGYIKIVWKNFTQCAEGTLNEIEKKLLTGPLWGERSCIRGSEYILFEILD